jgi:L-threonylcarbamoyladenylate synthase
MTHLGALSDIGQRLAARFWPGPLTLLVPASPALARDVTSGTGRVGVRVPADPIARAICRAVGRPMTATSANRSGQPATPDPDVVERTLGEDIDMLVDVGLTPGGPPSTIVDITEQAPRLVRAGAIAWEEIDAWLAADPQNARA